MHHTPHDSVRRKRIHTLGQQERHTHLVKVDAGESVALAKDVALEHRVLVRGAVEAQLRATSAAATAAAAAEAAAVAPRATATIAEAAPATTTAKAAAATATTAAAAKAATAKAAVAAEAAAIAAVATAIAAAEAATVTAVAAAIAAAEAATVTAVAAAIAAAVAAAVATTSNTRDPRPRKKTAPQRARKKRRGERHSSRSAQLCNGAPGEWQTLQTTGRVTHTWCNA